MFKIKDMSKIKDMGFICSGEDYVCRENHKTIFTIYKGSPYLRYSKSAYICDAQMKKIYDWSKEDYIEWET